MRSSKPLSKRFSYIPCYIHIVLLLLALMLLVVVNRQSQQAMPSFILPLTFEGSYRIGGSEWQTLDEDTKLNALDGDLILRGTFGEDQEYLTEGTMISCYLDYIMMTISVNGEVVYGGYPYTESLIRDLCSKAWVTWATPQMRAGDVVEIRLENPYRFGNADAYNEFLRMIVPATPEKLQGYLDKQTQPYWVAGLGMVICALVLFGMAFAGFSQHRKSVGVYMSGGLLVLFAGGFVMFDTLDISLSNQLYVVNSYARQIFLMLFVFELFALTGYYLSGKTKKLATIITVVSAVTDVAIMLVAFVTGWTLFGMMYSWTMIHAVLVAVTLFLCVYQLRTCGGENCLSLRGGCILYLVILAEIVNCYICWWESMLPGKIIFILLLFIYLAREIKQIQKNYFAAIREERLAEELRESRVRLSLGQIRSHFIYNVLTAINYTGQHDASKANDAVECFVRYLRSNVDVLQNDKLIPFEQEMAHLRDYIALEKIHYDEEICFKEELEVTDFLIPPLVIQPLVENAIHHGFDKMQKQGSITVATRRSEDTVTVTITDDGAGFDQTKPVREGAVGVRNVCFRIEQMIGGTMHIESHPGKGTTVTIQIPVRDVFSVPSIAH